MANGHLGKCIECCRKDSRRNGKTEKSKEREKKRNSTESRKSHINKTSKKWRIKYPEKYKAHIKVNNALRDRKIFKPNACEECSRDLKLHAHHEDYSKPLDVKWLCVECHGKKNPNYIG